MIILPDRNVPRSKFILPVPKKEWMIPSLAQPKDQFGKENRTYFVIRAHVHDGKIVWRGVYEDRDDFDAVLWAIANDTLKYERELWPLSTPNWDPWIGELPQYSFVTYTNKTSPTGSNQTYDKPSDWNNTNNKIECIGAGASGGSAQVSTGNATGGGAGAYSRIANFSFTGSTATYNIGTGGLAVAGTLGLTALTNGNNGGPTYFNATSDPGNGTDNTKCSAAGGSKGLTGGTNLIVNGGAGGATTSSWGQNKYAGGAGGSCAVININRFSTGGGGAGGSTGTGNNGPDHSEATNSNSLDGGAGGAGDAGVGSAGSAGTKAVGSGATGGSGGNGTNLSDGTVGTGGGGGGANGQNSNSAITGGSGGNYGGGGGGAANAGQGNNNSSKSTSGAGIGGLLIISYTPETYRSGSMFILFN